MREIKFRAWDKVFKKMLVAGDSNLPDLTCNGCPVEPHTRKNLSMEMEIMQYTGLRDKNGKDIWEGDILIVPAEGTWPEYKYIVDFWHGSFVAKETGSSGLNNYPNNFNFRASEVIGNIHENPELLTP